MKTMIISVHSLAALIERDGDNFTVADALVLPSAEDLTAESETVAEAARQALRQWIADNADAYVCVSWPNQARGRGKYDADAFYVGPYASLAAIRDRGGAEPYTPVFGAFATLGELLDKAARR